MTSDTKYAILIILVKIKYDRGVNLKNEDLKKQLLFDADEIIKIVSKGNTAEIKKNKEGIFILEVSRKKIKKDLTGSITHSINRID